MEKKSISCVGRCLLAMIGTMVLLTPPVLAQDALSVSDKEIATDVFNLDQIVVTATKTPHLLKDVPVQTVVITNDDITNTSAQTVSDILRSVPGLFVVSEDIPGISSWRTKLRGLDLNSGYGLILVNGQRVKGGGMGEYGYGVNQVPLSSIDRIEIIKGPGSVLYGSDAMGGVINIITKSTPKEPMYGLELAAGSKGSRIGSVYGGISRGDQGVFFNAAARESDVGAYGYNTSRDEEYSSKRIDSRVSYRFTDKVKADLFLAVEDEERTRRYKTKDVLRKNSYKKYRVSPTLDIEIDDSSSATITGYYYNWNMGAMETGSDSSGFTPTVGDMFYNDVEVRYFKTFQDKFQLTLGTEYLQEKLDYNMANESIDTYSSYAQVEAKIIDNLIVVLGARYDDHEKYGDYLSPKISFMYQLFNDTIFRGSAGKGFKSPTIRQLYYTELYQHGTYWYRSNPNLDAEKSWGYSFGVEQGINDRILFDLTFFRNDIKDKVLNIDTGEFEEGLPITTYKNVSKAHTQGLELGLKAIVTKALTGTLSYTFTDTENEDTGNEITYVPTNNITAGMTYNYKPWGLNFTANVQYADEMFTDTENTQESGDYTLVDLKLSKDLGRYCALSIEGNNVFDSDYGQPNREWLGATYLVRFKMDL